MLVCATRCESREGRLNEPIKGGDTGAETAHMKYETDHGYTCKKKKNLAIEQILV